MERSEDSRASYPAGIFTIETQDGGQPPRNELDSSVSSSGETVVTSRRQEMNFLPFTPLCPVRFDTLALARSVKACAEMGVITASLMNVMRPRSVRRHQTGLFTITL